MGSDENRASAGQEHNDLKGVISGIGPTYAGALHKVGIRCVEELAQREPDDLLDTLCPLREQGFLRSLPRIDDVQSWANQAKIVTIVGPTYTQALRKIDIHCVEDLAQWTASELLESLFPLYERGCLTSLPALDDVKGWIGQARKRVQRAHLEHTPLELVAEAAKDPQQMSIENDWQEHAAFSVFIEYEIDEDGERVWQTWVSDDKDHKELEGIDIAGTVNWILERANLPVDAEAILTKVETAAPTALAAPQIGILDADVNQSSVAPEQKLVAEVRFETLSPEAETLIKKEVPFEILFRTVNSESGAVDLVGSEQGQLNPLTREYLVKHEFPIPDLGHYELETIVLLLPPGEIMAYRHRGPPFGVVPR